MVGCGTQATPSGSGGGGMAQDDPGQPVPGGPADGDLGGACFANNTCFGDLECVEGLCVAMSPCEHRPACVVESEPNNSFDQSLKATFDAGGSAMLEGDIASRDDLDVYSIGPLVAGDRLMVTTETPNRDLDISIAVFDSNFELFFDNDDEDTDRDLFDSVLDEVIRHDGEPYYLVVGASAFAGGGDTSGDYTATIIVEPTDAVPPPSQQILRLDFSGGPVAPDNLLTKTVEPFSAAAIDPIYEGQDDIIIDALVTSIRQNFARFDVQVVTDPVELAPDAVFSTIMFGGRSGLVFGISEAVDHYNARHGDMAIIFTESFDPAKFTETPSAEQLGLAIGNITAHETGHLLGLQHVNDVIALMDGASPADTVLEDQEFKTGPLSSDILPIGLQNAARLLSESVGLLPGVTLPDRVIPRRPGGPRLKETGPASWCGTCSRKGR